MSASGSARARHGRVSLTTGTTAMSAYLHSDLCALAQARPTHVLHVTSMYVLWYVRPSPARRFIDSALRPHAMFSAVKSAWSKQLRHSALI